MTKIKFYQSLTFKLTLALTVVAYLLSLMFYIAQIFMIDRNTQPNIELDAWFNKVQAKLEQIVKNDENKMMMEQQLGNVFTQPSMSFSFNNREYEVDVNGVALISKDSTLLAQVGDFSFVEGDVGAQVPIRSRDDLSDSIVGHYNTGLERYDKNHVYIRPIINSESQISAIAMFLLQWPDAQFESTNLHFLQNHLFPDALINSLIPLIFVLPCGFCIIFFAGKQLKYRLNHLYTTIAFWSKGELHHKIELSSNDELGISFRRLNKMADELAKNIQADHQLHILQHRNVLAAELHDTVKQQLFANNLNLATCRQVLESDTAQTKSLIDLIAKQNQAIFDKINALVSTLHRPETNTPIRNQLENLIQDWQAVHSLTVEYEITLDTELKLPAPIREICNQATREALQNIHKHSNATEVSINVWMDKKTIYLSIQDNGNNASCTSLGQGLKILKSNVEFNAGTLLIETHDEIGFSIAIQVPLTEDTV
ncbi:histidine kinase [Agaribacter marinus]|uniref:histidine kinase n=1 Tax=Agaribacter marinus TaxID=1431249 RepID=A0AA37WJ90_9ALTE|nr:histidine kinase [Agaribacter marinus]GLR73006.1 hypothetical protein GCM10007852_39140 [Agaribacter marinus]